MSRQFISTKVTSECPLPVLPTKPRRSTVQPKTGGELRRCPEPECRWCLVTFPVEPERLRAHLNDPPCRKGLEA